MIPYDPHTLSNDQGWQGMAGDGRGWPGVAGDGRGWPGMVVNCWNLTRMDPGWTEMAENGWGQLKMSSNCSKRPGTAGMAGNGPHRLSKPHINDPL